MTKLYYTAPSDEIFNEVKKASMDLWTERYPEATNPYYAKEKVSEIERLQNVGDNMMSIVARFDSQNMRLLAEKLSVEASKAIGDRMIDGGNEMWNIPFLISDDEDKDINQANDMTDGNGDMIEINEEEL